MHENASLAGTVFHLISYLVKCPSSDTSVVHSVVLFCDEGGWLVHGTAGHLACVLIGRRVQVIGRCLFRWLACTRCRWLTGACTGDWQVLVQVTGRWLFRWLTGACTGDCSGNWVTDRCLYRWLAMICAVFVDRCAVWLAVLCRLKPMIQLSCPVNWNRWITTSSNGNTCF